MTEDETLLIGKVTFHLHADYHDFSEIAARLEDSGYIVNHITDPTDDDPHLYIEREAEQ